MLQMCYGQRLPEKCLISYGNFNVNNVIFRQYRYTEDKDFACIACQIVRDSRDGKDSVISSREEYNFVMTMTRKKYQPLKLEGRRNLKASTQWYYKHLCAH